MAQQIALDLEAKIILEEFSDNPFLPLFYKNGWKYALLGSFLAIAIPSFIIEQTLETQLGTAIYLVFLLMAARYYFIKDPSDQSGRHQLLAAQDADS